MSQETQSPVRLVVLAGGSGTRFWPASRRARPKQLLPLTGGAPMIVETVARVMPLLAGPQDVFVASGKAVERATREALPEVPRDNHLAEPCARNTAPCIGWATARIARADPEAVIVVLPSDHHVQDLPEFQRVLGLAIDSARRGRITTIGIRPTRPETGFGYIEIGEGEREVSDVRRFVEKPDLERAKSFLESGRFLWNAGMFIYRACDMLRAIEQFLPELSAALRAFDEAAAVGDEAAKVAELFPTLGAVSIDVGVMEKVASLAVVSGDFGWSDVGSWQAAWELAERDENENGALGHVHFVEARGNLVIDGRAAGAAKKTLVLVGVEDLVVVETEDAILVVPRDRAQDVRLAVERLSTVDPELL